MGPGVRVMAMSYRRRKFHEECPALSFGPFPFVREFLS